MDTINPQRPFAYQPGAEQRSLLAAAHAVHPVAVVGAGPVGLTAAIDLAQRGIPVVVLDEDDTLAAGSRAICFAKRTLDILDRLGCGERIAAKGVSWHVGKVFFGDEQVYRFDLLPEAGHRRPAFINLQQYYLESFLIEHAAGLPGIELRWRHRVTGVAPGQDKVALTVSTPEGDYVLHARYVVAADGAHSGVRQGLGLESKGRVFHDRFLIADVKMAAPFPAERWFWFDPPFNPGRSALLHRQPDDVWRLDFQLGWDADPETEKQPGRVIPRIRAMLGDDVAFTLEWVSVYTFCCQRMDAFRHGRVLFAGDAAHRVSPFGARGANSGVQDAENLAWKLALVLAGRAGDALLDSYASEREAAADENIRHSTRSTDFITPKSAVSRTFRDAVLRLARRHAFARHLVNSGRLSLPTVLRDSPLNTPDRDVFAGAMVPGAPCVDAPLQRHGDARPGWLLGELGNDFTLLVFGDGGAIPAEARRRLATAAVPVRLLFVVPPGAPAAPPAAPPEGPRHVSDAEGLAAGRYDGRPGTCYLIRPDQHVCARWRDFDAEAVLAALLRALCLPANGQIH